MVEIDDDDDEDDPFGFCKTPNCCMPGEHFRSECYTPEMAEQNALTEVVESPSPNIEPWIKPVGKGGENPSDKLNEPWLKTSH